MIQDQLMPTWRFWLMWFVAFIGFPIGGLLANALVGPVLNPVSAALGGAITGAVLGLAQWFVLRQQFALLPGWVIATSAGMAVGLAAGVAVLGSETGGAALLWRALITGLGIGLAQALLLRFNLSLPLPLAALWIVTLGLAWTLGWFITRSVGVDLGPKWTVFGSTGAWAFQLLTGLLIYLLRTSQIK